MICDEMEMYTLHDIDNDDIPGFFCIFLKKDEPAGSATTTYNGHPSKTPQVKNDAAIGNCY